MPFQLQKPVAVKANAAVARAGTKPAKKVAVKGKEKKTEEVKVIVISPDKNQEVPKQAADTSRSRTKSTRKKVTTLSSVLTARSKVKDQFKHLHCYDLHVHFNLRVLSLVLGCLWTH